MNYTAMTALKKMSATIREHAFPFDPDFPQLELASDPARILEIFRRHLKPVAGKRLEILECVPVRFRCRQSSSRCVLQFALGVMDQYTGQRHHSWVTLVRYAEPGLTEETWVELNSTNPRRQIPEALLTFEPLGFIRELGMLVEVYPYDPRLPTLPVALGGPSPGLRRKLLARFGAGDWRIEDQTIEPMRYRTELGGVLRYTLRAREAASGRTQTQRFYAKVYRGDRGEQTWKLLRYLCGNPVTTRNKFSVAQPIDYSRERQCLVLAEAPGRSLQDVFLSGEDSEMAARHVARAVAAFNQSDIPGPRVHTPEDQIKYLTKTMALLRWVCPDSVELLDEIAAAVRAGLKTVPVASIHWDLKTDHVFLDDDRVIFIDVDTVAAGDPVRDPAHLLAHIVCRIGLPAMPFEKARAAGRAFVEEYFASVPADWQTRLPVQYAAAVVETAAGIFKRQEPRWREQVTAAIAEARRTLEEGFK
ncbi:MAG: hypothetical protein EPO07_08935 [Verrucomicrobia bacterium]|nr:MAG: hypothetical protein EPO07_08935 [Verrucomicrobiota bacterium]